MPELGFHIALCPECRAMWERLQAASATSVVPLAALHAVPVESYTSPAETPVDGACHADECAQAADSPSVIPATILQDRPVAAEHGTLVTVDPIDQLDELSAVDLDEQQSLAPADPSGKPRVVTYRMLLANRNFRRLWLGEAISTFGSYFTRVAIPIFIFSLTGSTFQLGLAFFSSLIASLLFGLFAGALVDRWDRRRTMIWADLANGLLLVPLMALVALPGTIPQAVVIAGIYVVNFGAALLRELFTPARIAILSDILAEDELLAANSLDRATTTLAELVSYPFAGAVLVFLGPALAFGVDAATFFISALLIWGVHAVQSIAPAEDSNIWQEIREGVATTLRLPLVREIVLLSLIVPLLTSLTNVLQLPLAVDVLGSEEAVGFPALEAAMALGVVLGMLALGRWGQRIPRSSLLAYGIGSMGAVVLLIGQLPSFDLAFGLSTKLLGAIETLARTVGMQLTGTWYGAWTPRLLLALPLMLCVGATNSLILASIRTVLQERTPRAVLGRVASVMSVAAGLGFAVGALLAGFGQGRVSLVFTLIGIGLCTIGLACRWWLPRDDHARAATVPSS